MSEIYVIGHKSPDLDSVAAAISYAEFKNKLRDGNSYKPARAGELNRETKYVLERFGFQEPEKLESIAQKQVILVDHNETAQCVDGFEEAEIVEVLDHHKINFDHNIPIFFRTMPWGASATIIARDFLKANLGFSKNLAGLMLAAILVDTVITKSPTCTEKDKQIINKLAEIADISDWRDFGVQVFKVRSSIGDLSADQIIKNDYKEYDFKAGKFLINQIETVDLRDFDSRTEELKEAMKKLKDSGYHSVVTFITDIFKEGSRFLIVTDDEKKMSEALGKDVSGEVYLDGVMSRKKQVLPMFMEAFDK